MKSTTLSSMILIKKSKKKTNILIHDQVIPPTDNAVAASNSTTHKQLQLPLARGSNRHKYSAQRSDEARDKRKSLVTGEDHQHRAHNYGQTRGDQPRPSASRIPDYAGNYFEKF